MTKIYLFSRKNFPYPLSNQTFKYNPPNNMPMTSIPYSTTLKQIRIHGRGGQGAVTSAELLAIAAFKDNKYSQSFPYFGVARRGAPVQAFTRIDNHFIRLRQQVKDPNYVMVLDATLLDVVNVADGIKKGGMIIINSSKTPGELGLKGDYTVKTEDITKIALEIIGKPFVNTPMLGAFSKATGEVTIESIEAAIKENMPKKIADTNILAAREVYDNLK